MLVQHWVTHGIGHQGDRQRRSPALGPNRAALSPGAGVLEATRSGCRAGWSRGPAHRCIADDDHVPVKIDVLDAQTDALHQAQAAAVAQAGHQLVHTGH